MYNLRKRTQVDYTEYDVSDYECCPACKESYVVNNIFYPEYTNYDILLLQLFEFISDDNYYLKNLFYENENTVYEDLVGLSFE